MDKQNTLSILGIPQILLEGKNIYDISSFYKEINRVFMQNEDWELGESLDALNDLLYGGHDVVISMYHLPNISLSRTSKILSHRGGKTKTNIRGFIPDFRRIL